MSEASAATVRSSRSVNAWRDLGRGVMLWPFWLRLGVDDIRQRYVRTALGPVWMLINSGMWIVALALVGSALFGLDIAKTFPFVTAGMCAWLVLAAILGESCHVFLGQAWLLNSSPLPASFHLYRHLVRMAITFLHYLPILIGILALCRVWPSLSMLGLAPVMLAYLVFALWAGAILGVLTLRYRDVPHLLATVTSIVPIVTPLMWSREMLKQYQWVADFNPIYHYVEIFRAAALTQPTPWTSWMVVLVLNAMGLVLAFGVYSNNRGRLALLI